MKIITVPMVPISPNSKKARHHMAKWRQTMQWEHDLKYGIGCSRHRQELQKLAKANRMRVDITVYHPRVTDDDNMAAALKPVLDALTRNGYIQNDSPDKLELVLPVKQILCDEKKTIVKISVAS